MEMIFGSSKMRILDPKTTLAFSDGKSLGETTLNLVAEASMVVSRKHSRDDLGKISGCPGFSNIVFARADQVVWLVQRGYVAAGITGLDHVKEADADIQVCASLSYSRATNGGISCVVFAPSYSPVATIDQLREYCAKQHVLFVSEYERELTDFLQQKQIRARGVLQCSGKAEMLVRIGVGEFGATITETGTSLQKNDCRILKYEDGEPVTVFESSTVIVANKKLYADVMTKQHVDSFCVALSGVLNARGKTLLKMNAPTDCVDKIRTYLKAMHGALGEPTISGHHGNATTCSIESVVPTQELNFLRMELAALGASGFIDFAPKTVT